MFQSLEPRLLFSQLVITGTAGDDSLSILGNTTTDGGFDGILFSLGTSSSDATALTATLDGTSISFDTLQVSDLNAATPITSIVIDLGGGSDLCAAEGGSRANAGSGLQGVNVPVTIRGGAGNDAIAGSGANDVVDGGAGDDLLFTSGDEGVDSLFGGDGNDELYARGGAQAWMRGENGDDTFYVAAGDQSPKRNRIIGGPGVDAEHAFFGNRDDFSMAADVENLTIESPDNIRAGVIRGNDLSNRITFETSQSNFGSNPGRPYVVPSYDLIDAGAGNDTVDASPVGSVGVGEFEQFPGSVDATAMNTDALNVIAGGAGNDTLIAPRAGVGGATMLRGGAGDDTFVARLPGGVAADPAFDLPGASNVWVDYSDAAGPVTVTLNGVADDGPVGETDVIDPAISNVRGSAFDDVLFGNANDNVLDGGTGNDLLRGFAGTDYLVFTGRRRGVTGALAAFASRRVNAEHDRVLPGIEALIGTRFNDTLYGSPANDTIWGGSGDDVIDAGAGNDTLVGRDGADTLLGGDGEDTARYATVSGDVPAERVTLDALPNDVEPQSDGRPTVTTEDVRTENVENVGTVVGDGGPNKLVGVTGSADGGDGDDLIELAGTAAGFGGAGNDTFTNQNGQANAVDGGPGLDAVQDEIGGVDTLSNAEIALDRLDVDVQPSLKRAVAVATAAEAAAVASVYLDGRRILRVNGTPGDDIVTLTQSGRVITAYVSGVMVGTFNARRVRLISVEAGNGNDVVLLRASRGRNPVQVTAVMNGGSGDDVLAGGAAGDVISGQGGNDTIDGGAGNDNLSGDAVTAPNAAVPEAATRADGNDLIIGGEGSVDVVSYTNRAAGVTIDLRGGRRSFSGNSGERDRIIGVEHATGGQGGDFIIGSDADDVLVGGPGDDTVRPGLGIDRTFSETGSDIVATDGAFDFFDTGAERAVDRVVGNLDDSGDVPLSVEFEFVNGVFNDRDFFTLAGRYFGTAESSDN